MALLECNSILKRFGKFVALNHLDTQIEKGSIFGVVGPNGSGKTTFFNVITGLLVVDRGQILFKGKDISKWKAHRICKWGIARTFQVPSFFTSMFVIEQVETAAAFGRVNGANSDAKAHEVLEFVGLSDKKVIPVRTLITFDKKLLMIATALATEPDLLLLDEPLAGLNDTEITSTMDLIKEINKNGVTVAVIEHNMNAIMEMTNKVLVLDHGEKIAEGDPTAVANDAQVIKVYLGEEFL